MGKGNQLVFSELARNRSFKEECANQYLAPHLHAAVSTSLGMKLCSGE